MGQLAYLTASARSGLVFQPQEGGINYRAKELHLN